MTAVACENCHYADPTVLDDVDGAGPDAVLLCRRHPPTMLMDGDAAAPAWPVVAATDWCGDFYPRKPA